MFQAFVGTGFNLLLNYDTSTNFNPAHRQSDFDREPGKVSKQFEFEDLSQSECGVWRSQYWWGRLAGGHSQPWNIKQGNWTFSKESSKLCCPDRLLKAYSSFLPSAFSRSAAIMFVMKATSLVVTRTNIVPLLQSQLFMSWLSSWCNKPITATSHTNKHLRPPPSAFSAGEDWEIRNLMSWRGGWSRDHRHRQSHTRWSIRNF